MLLRPYPDELIGSMLARTSVRVGSVRLVVDSVRGARSSALVSFYLPLQLPRISELSGIELETLAYEHTPLRYVAAYMPERERERLRDLLLDGATDNRSNRSVVSALTGNFAALRCCPECIRSDLTAYGESYWRRAHNLPGVHLCLQHNVWLRRVRQTKRGREALFEFVPVHLTPLTIQRPAIQFDIARSIAIASVDVLQGRAPLPADETLRALALDRGYRVANGDVAGLQMAVDLRDYFGKSFLTYWRAPISTGNRSAPWPAVMVRPKEVRTVPPLKHLLLRTFLSASTPESKDVPYSKAGPSSRQYRQLDRQLVGHVRRCVRSAIARGVRVTVLSLLIGSGLYRAYRQHRLKFPKTVAALESFKKSASAERQTGRRPRKSTAR